MPSTRPRELGDVVEQLHTLLDQSGFERPFVLAGHSIGAIIMREYVARYPGDVVGLAFLDGSHPDQARRLGLENLDLKAEAEQGISIYRLLVRSGLSRLYDPALTPVKAAFPKHIFAELQYTTDRSYFDTVLAEYDGLAPYTDRPRPNDNFGDRPTVVIQAGETWDPATLPDNMDAAKVAAGWSKLQQDTATLSTKGRYVVVKNANHMSLIHDQAYANEVRISSARCSKPHRTLSEDFSAAMLFPGSTLGTSAPLSITNTPFTNTNRMPVLRSRGCS